MFTCGVILLESKKHYTYEQIHQLTIKAGENILNEHIDYDYIVGVLRGGLVPATILSHYTGIPLDIIKWSTRDFTQNVVNHEIAKLLNEGVNIVLVDDINDSGRTFFEIKQSLNYNSDTKGKLTTISVLERHNTQYKSDYCGEIVSSDDWICFPWEPEIDE